MPVTFKIDGGLKNFKGYLAALRGGAIERTDQQARYHIAQKVEAIIKRRYRAYNAKYPVTKLGAVIRTLGKRKGAVKPPRMPRGTLPVSEHLALSIKRWMVGKAHHVGIPKGAKYEGRSDKYRRGTPMQLVANWVENPRPSVIPLTMRMIGYLETMRRGKKGHGSRAKRPPMPDRAVGVLKVGVHPRPVWKNLTGDLRRALKGYDREMSKSFASLARRHGGKATVR